MKRIISICLLALPMSSSLLAAEIPKPDAEGFRTKVVPLLEKYCIDCHGADDPEANLSLHTIDADLVSGKHYETWRMIDEQIRFSDMPPKDENQPTTDERFMLCFLPGPRQPHHAPRPADLA